MNEKLCLPIRNFLFEVMVLIYNDDAIQFAFTLRLYDFLEFSFTFSLEFMRQSQILFHDLQFDLLFHQFDQCLFDKMTH